MSDNIIKFPGTNPELNLEIEEMQSIAVEILECIILKEEISLSLAFLIKKLKIISSKIDGHPSQQDIQTALDIASSAHSVLNTGE